MWVSWRRFCRRRWAAQAVSVRLGVVLTVLLAELLGLCRWVRPAGPYVWMPAVFAYATLLLAHRSCVQKASEMERPRQKPHGMTPGARVWLGVHCLLLVALIASEVVFAELVRELQPEVFAVAAVFAAVALCASLLAAFVSAKMMRGMLHPLIVAMGWAAVIVGLIFVVARGLGAAWQTPSSAVGRAMALLTFSAVHTVLRWFYPFVYVRPSDLVIGTRGFGVRLAASCSGMESLGLMLVFSVAWLVWMRREIVLARGLFLVPAMLGVMWGLNVLRLAVLIALGSAGHAHFALTAFHSHAGWLLFDAAMVGFFFVTSRWEWLRRSVPRL